MDVPLIEQRPRSSVWRASLGGLFVGCAGWLASTVVLGDFVAAVQHPAPLVYTEGVMMWASRELDRGKSPYGDINNIPSRYFCYGPGMAKLVAAVGHDGPSYLRAGRIVAGLSLFVASILCGLIAKRLGAGQWGGWAAGVFFFLAVFCSHHVWSFRVDTTVVALGLGAALAALIYCRGGGIPWLVLAAGCGLLGGALKFTSCFWGLWIFLLCGGAAGLEEAFRHKDWSVARRGVGGALAYGVGWIGAIIATEILYPGSTADQTLSQAGSGLNPWGYTRNTVVDAFSLAALPWAAVIGAVCLGWGGRIAGIALAAWILSVGMLLKFGSDINYFFDGFALVSIAAGAGVAQAWAKGGGVLALTVAMMGFFFTTTPMKNNMPHRMLGENATRELVGARETAYLFRGDAGLCEDAFFPVFHGGEVLISDPFQASLSPEFSARARTLASTSGRIVAGDRLGRALGGVLWGNFAGARWTRSAGVPGTAVYLASAAAQEVRRAHPLLKLQAAPGELRIFAASGETLDWEGVALAFGKLGSGRKIRFVSEDESPLDYQIFSGDGGTGGW